MAQAAPDTEFVRKLGPMVQAFNSESNDQVKLGIAYQALKVYGNVKLKTQVNRELRNPLSDMKRLVLFEAMKNNPESQGALVVGIGSTGKWMLDRQQNNYDAARPNDIVKYKLEGLYMEGLSDLDFPIMGARAIAYTNQLKAILRQGGISEDDLERLEISFLVDNQIDNVRADGDPRRFWNQMLDVERSSSHSEKYITKGGKALYCIEHLIESGATIQNGMPLPMQQWAKTQGHEIGPFGIQFLLGGCADMDYFLRHACDKTDQEKTKTILQLIKYAKRQSWMLQSAANAEQSLRRLEAVGLSGSQFNDLIRQLKNNSEYLNKLVQETIESKPWNSDVYFGEFKNEFRRLSELSCETAHEWTLVAGNALLDKVHAKQATEKQLKLLYQIAYDLETMHRRRYPHGYPASTHWYTEKQQMDTLEFLERFKFGRAIAEETWPETPMPWRTVLTPMEIGPIIPPPFATVQINSVKAVPLSPGDRGPAASDALVRHQITIEGQLSGLLKSKPGDAPLWQAPPISGPKMRVLQDLVKDLRSAELLALKIGHLVELRAQKVQADQMPVFVSEFEFAELADELELLQDDIRRGAKRLDPDLNANSFTRSTGVNVGRPPITPTSSLQDVGQYLSALSNAANDAKKMLIVTRAVAKQAGDAHIGPEAKKAIHSVYEQSDALLGDLMPLLNQRDQYLRLAKDVTNIAQGDPKTIARKASELSDYLDKLADAVEQAAADSRNQEKKLVDSIYLLRQSAWKDDPSINDFIGTWENIRSDLFRQIADLQQDSVGIRHFSQLAKSAGVAIDLAGQLMSKYKDYRDTIAKLETEILDSNLRRMVLGLKVTGDVMFVAAGFIPSKAVAKSYQDYASLLQKMPEVLIAWNTILLRRSQGEMLYLRTPPLPVYEGIMNANSDLDRNGFYLFNGPLAEHNGLYQRLIAWGDGPPAAGRFWLVVDSSSPEGFVSFVESPKDSARQSTIENLSRICGWHWLAHGKPIAREDLADLIVGRMTIIDNQQIKPFDLKLDASIVLSRNAWQKYLSGYAGLAPRDMKEQKLARQSLETASNSFASKGFMLHREDVYQLLRHLRQESRTWAGTRREPTMEGELPSIVAKMLRDKQNARDEERQRAWNAALQQGAAGLKLKDISLQFKDAVAWKGGQNSGSFDHVPAGESFVVRRAVEVPANVEGKSVYAGQVWIQNHRTTTCDFGANLLKVPPQPTDMATGDLRGIVRGGLDPVRVKEVIEKQKRIGWAMQIKAPNISLNVETGEVTPKKFVFEAIAKSLDGIVETYRIEQTFVGSAKEGSGQYFSGPEWSGKRRWVMEWFNKEGKRTSRTEGDGNWWAQSQKDGSWLLSVENAVAPIFGDIPFRLNGNVVQTVGAGNLSGVQAENDPDNMPGQNPNEPAANDPAEMDSNTPADNSPLLGTYTWTDPDGNGASAKITIKKDVVILDVVNHLGIQGANGRVTLNGSPQHTHLGRFPKQLDMIMGDGPGVVRGQIAKINNGQPFTQGYWRCDVKGNDYPDHYGDINLFFVGASGDYRNYHFKSKAKRE